MKKGKTLLIMAAGMGSRYGGLKQIEPVGPNGEILIDYGIYDAVKAGITKVVCIIKEEFAEEFKQKLGSRIEKHIETKYVYQEMNDVPKNIIIPSNRTKPLGTVQAILAARHEINEPFIVINADDFYGYDGYKVLSEFIDTLENGSKNKYAMAGYRVANTLSEHGTVKRAIAIMEGSNLIDLEESIVGIVNDKIVATPLNKEKDEMIVEPNTHVSLNMFAFTEDIMKTLERKLKEYLEANQSNLMTCEYLISEVLQELIEQKEIELKVVDTSATWMGMTYKEDKDEVVEEIQNLINSREYPNQLW